MSFTPNSGTSTPTPNQSQSQNQPTAQQVKKPSLAGVNVKQRCAVWWYSTLYRAGSVLRPSRADCLARLAFLTLSVPFPPWACAHSPFSPFPLSAPVTGSASPRQRQSMSQMVRLSIELPCAAVSRRQARPGQARPVLQLWPAKERQTVSFICAAGTTATRA
jgi:hypothetical protein